MHIPPTLQLLIQSPHDPTLTLSLTMLSQAQQQQQPQHQQQEQVIRLLVSRAACERQVSRRLTPQPDARGGRSGRDESCGCMGGTMRAPRDAGETGRASLISGAGSGTRGWNVSGGASGGASGGTSRPGELLVSKALRVPAEEQTNANSSSAAVPNAVVEAVASTVAMPPTVTALIPDTKATLSKAADEESDDWYNVGELVQDWQARQAPTFQGNAFLLCQTLEPRSKNCTSSIVARPPRSCSWSCAE